MKKSERVYQQLQTIVAQTFTDMIGEIIVRIDKGYVLYNRYHVTRDPDCITVYRRQDAEKFTFSTMKHAIVWITLDKFSRFYERDALYRLDKSLSSVQVEKRIHVHLRKKHAKDIEIYPIYSTKYQCDVTKERTIVAEIDKYYKLATKCHLQGIKNETNRTSKK
jgi:hypothetical protein